MRSDEVVRLPGGVLREPLTLHGCYVRFERPVYAFAPLCLLNCVVDCPTVPVRYRGRGEFRRKVGGQRIVFHRGSEESVIGLCYFPAAGRRKQS